MARHTLGEHITELRNTYSISRETLAERSGLAVGLIKKIEDEGLIPDLAPLIKIARALGVRLGTLLDDHEQLGPVISRAESGAESSVRFVTGLPVDKPETSSGQSSVQAPAAAAERQGLVFKALAADKNSRHMEPFTVEIKGDARPEKSIHEGEEFIYVLEGKLRLEYGTLEETLNAGDSVYYDSIVPHRVFSADSDTVRILAVIYTPV